jgi:4-hydroxyphenylpyruvate dioxygenase
MIKALDEHGEGIDDVAFAVSNVSAAYNYVIEHGGISKSRPKNIVEKVDGKKQIVMTQAAMGSCGPVEHTLIDRSHYRGVFAPGYVGVHEPMRHSTPVGLTHIDHFVLNVELDQMDPWADYYANKLGFRRLMAFTAEQISTGKAALRSVVMRSANGTITMPINEPVEGKFGHIDEFLRDRRGPGVQHLALATNDIVTTVRTLKDRGEEFLAVPDTYYDAISERLRQTGLTTEVPRDLIETLAKLGILIDADQHGYLLQIFTKVLIGEGAGFFFEIIQRCGCEGFGEGNFKALFESIERASGRL